MLIRNGSRRATLNIAGVFSPPLHYWYAARIHSRTFSVGCQTSDNHIGTMRTLDWGHQAANAQLRIPTRLQAHPCGKTMVRSRLGDRRTKTVAEGGNSLGRQAEGEMSMLEYCRLDGGWAKRMTPCAPRWRMPPWPRRYYLQTAPAPHGHHTTDNDPSRVKPIRWQ